MASMYRWVVLLAFLFPMGTLAAFIVDDFTKPALTCKPFLLQWQGGIAPWTLSVIQAGNSVVLENLGTLKVTSFEWNVDLAAGTSVLIQLQDSTGTIATSKTLIIQTGSTDCALSTVATKQTTTTRTTTSSTVATLTSASAFTTFSSRRTTSEPSTALTVTFSAVLTTFLTRSSMLSISAPPSTTTSPANVNQQSPTSVVIPVSTSILPSSANAVAGVGGASESGTGAFSTTSPQALGTLKTSTPVGVILGILFPGLLLLMFFGIFIFRRRRRSTTDVEELSYADPNTPAWFMRPAYHSESSGVSYGTQSSGSYGTIAPGNQPSAMLSPSTVAPSDSVSRASISYPEFSSEYAQSPTVNFTTEQRMRTFTFPVATAEPPSPPLS